MSYLRGLFPEDHYKVVDMRNLDSERRRRRRRTAVGVV